MAFRLCRAVWALAPRKMVGSSRPARSEAKAALACLCLTALAHPGPAFAATPSLLWTDAKQVSITCLAQSATTADAALFEARLCQRVRALAEGGAPVPVKQLQLGDPQLTAPGTLILLVHASVERARNGRTVAFTIRPYRPAASDSEVLFGTRPQVVSIGQTGAEDGSLDASIRAALAELLPWRQASRPQARPL
jgi:hypothetical protein